MCVEAQALQRYAAIAGTLAQRTSAAHILYELHAAGVPVILLKGITLVERIYPAPGQRVMGDVDLLVRRADLPRAEAVLQAYGFVFSDEGKGHTPEFGREFMGQIAYRKDTVVIELHWHPVALRWYRLATAFDVEGLWARALPATVDGVPALRLCPDDEIIHLCYHEAVHHGLAHRRGYEDIAGVIRAERENLDWDALVRRARAWHVSTACWIALTLARDLVQADVPAYVLEALEVPGWRRALLQPWIRLARVGRLVMVSGRMRFLGVLLVDRLCDLPRVLWRGLFPGRRWLRARFDLSGREAWIRQFAYPVEVIWRGARALLRTG